ncbi:hypothetical protein NDU88_002342 [Pleurodeles waltl]|uniref:Uncharacterized protein n=1 Tax=Pleurodeles waltl TaxID=8319 RepID=A0AAV7PF09_PLEWA|nr:hypothetical protein NDU88_002342 [Pleurodeles waltl]
MHPPSMQRIYPDVPVLETISNLVVRSEQVLPRLMLVQTEPTPILLPSAQPQGLPKFTLITGIQSDVTPVMNQAMGVTFTQGVSVRAAPDAISLPITVGPVVLFFAQKKASAGDQNEMSQSLVRRGVSDPVQTMLSVGQTFNGSRPLMDLSPLVALTDAINGPNASQGLKNLTPQTSGAAMQQVPVPNASNISLQGLSVQQLSEWLDSLNTAQNITMDEEQINCVRLTTEATELVEGMMELNRLESYTEEELRYLCPWITREVSKILQKLAELAEKHVIEIEKTKHLKRSYRFVKGLRPEVGQMIKSYLISWQSKLTNEGLQYAKYCSDEIELKQKKLKEKAMVMQIKAAQTGVQGALVPPMLPQQRSIMFQPQIRGRGRGMDMMRGPDLGTVVVQNDVQGMKKMLLCHLCGNVGHWK